MASIRRLASMGPREIATRLRQAASGRADELRHRLGLSPMRPGQTGALPHGGAFFFDPAEARAWAGLWARRNPAHVAQTVVRAERIAAHKFPLLGYGELDFGSPIQWHTDPVHGVRSPLEPWRRIAYLGFPAVGDHKIVWELSRHQHLVTLVRAGLYTGEPRWLDEAIVQWRDWQRGNPYPLGINWTSTLEVAFRLLSWIWMDRLLGPDAPESFRRELLPAIGHSATYIERYLSTYFAPNTHLLGEGVALLFAGLLYDQFDDAPRWREQGWRIVLEQARAQVREDGFHFEQSTYYHVYALDFFLHARILAARNGLLSAELDATIESMAGALHGISQTGCAPRFGDDDGGRLFDPARNGTAGMLDPLAVCAVLFHRPECKEVRGDFTEEAWWLLGPEGAQRFDALAAPGGPPQSIALPASGYYAMAAPAKAALLVVDAGPHGWGRGGHGHADALSVQVLAGNQALLIDPGTGAYPVDLPIRNRLRGTAAHSTLEVDGRSQAEPAGSFAWLHHPRSTLHLWHCGRAVDLFAASHDGYQRLADPVTHRRWIVGWKKSGWLVRDTATARGVHRFDLRWRLAAGAELRIAIAEELGWQSQLEEAEFSPAYGAVQMAPVLHLHCERNGPVEAAAVLVPGGSPAELLCLHPSLYRWTGDGGIRFVWFSEEAGEALGWRTDAALVLLALAADGSVECLSLAGGSYLEMAGREVFRSPHHVAFLEWLPGDPAPEGARWDPGALMGPVVYPLP